MNPDSKMPPPDWGRWLVKQDLAGSPLGPMMRWGAQVRTNLLATDNNVFSDQFINVQTLDNYSRSWAIVGELTLPQTTWDDPGTYPAGPYPLVASIEITQGVGATPLVQEILLMCGNSPTAGLCNTQNAINGGPYQSRFFRTPTGVQNESRPFAAIGAIIGSMMQIRMRYVVGIGTGLPTAAVCTALVTPFAPGGGL